MAIRPHLLVAQGFNTQPRGGGCFAFAPCGVSIRTFQHTAARRRLPIRDFTHGFFTTFQHTAARRRLLFTEQKMKYIDKVSTHSRPKAAALSFIHACSYIGVSTHSRPKAAAYHHNELHRNTAVSTHSRAKAAAFYGAKNEIHRQSFNTQPPEGGCTFIYTRLLIYWGFNTQPPEGGCFRSGLFCLLNSGFNTQPPEGGCITVPNISAGCGGFNTQPPEGGCSRCL